MTTGKLHEALLLRYPRAEYALMEEVCEEVGGGRRRADYLALNFWRSRGLALEGLEKKISRSDWLRELKDPSKADAIARYCDKWWLLVSGPGIVKEEELPLGWGLLELVGARLIQRVKAAKLEPEPWPRKFVASMLRRAQGDVAQVEQTQTTESLDRAREQVEEQHRAEIERVLAQGRSNTRELLEAIETFEKATGINVRDALLGRLGRVGEAVRFIADGGLGGDDFRAPLKKLREELRTVQLRIDQVIAEANQTAAAPAEKAAS